MPNDYDKIFKENFEELIPDLLRLVMKWEIPKLEELKDKQQITLEREMDDLKKVVHDDPSLDYGLHWEIQTNDEDMRARLFLYYAMFYHKHRLPLKQIVIYIGDEPANLIYRDLLELENIRLQFSVVNLRTIPKDVFLQSDKPESVILAILSDFGGDQPETVIRQILNNLLKLIGRVDRLKKYQKQLHVLSRLRKLSSITEKAIHTMPIHYNIETDELYLEGREKGREEGREEGIEKGIEKGMLKKSEETVISLLEMQQFTVPQIAKMLRVTEEFVLQIADKLGLKVIR
jgi:predicted transposase YdaD